MRMMFKQGTYNFLSSFSKLQNKSTLKCSFKSIFYLLSSFPQRHNLWIFAIYTIKYTNEYWCRMSRNKASLQLKQRNRWLHSEVFVSSPPPAAASDSLAPPCRFCVVIKKENYPEQQQPAKRLCDSGKEIYRLPGHTIYLLPTVMLANLLPCDLNYYIKGTSIKGTLKPGKEAMLHGADTSQNMELGQYCSWNGFSAGGSPPDTGRRSRSDWFRAS